MSVKYGGRIAAVLHPYFSKATWRQATELASALKASSGLLIVIFLDLLEIYLIRL